MREHELIYILQPDLSEERQKEIHDRVDGALSAGQGILLWRDDWGKRKLAYEIRKYQKGHYFQLNFLGDGKFVAEIERLLRLDADVLRFLTVLVDESVSDVPARLEQAKAQAEEQAKRRAERERLEAERERAELESREREDDEEAKSESDAESGAA